VEISDTDTFVDLLKRVQREFFAVTEHQDFIPAYVSECQPEVFFNWGGLPTYSSRWSVDQSRGGADQLRMQPFPVYEVWPSKFLAFFSDTPAGILATINFRPDLLTQHSIERLGRNMRSVAEQLVQQPLGQVSSVSTES
jgi:hypothetical protein